PVQRIPDFPLLALRRQDLQSRRTIEVRSLGRLLGLDLLSSSTVQCRLPFPKSYLRSQRHESPPVVLSPNTVFTVRRHVSLGMAVGTTASTPSSLSFPWKSSGYLEVVAIIFTGLLGK